MNFVAKLIIKLICHSIMFLNFQVLAQTKLPEYFEKVEWLEENAIIIDTIHSNGILFKDLNQFKNIIGDARVVLLGEQSHGDGSTFLAKVGLVEFLHREMGFDVLIFESEFYSGLKLDDSLAVLSEPVIAERKLLESNIYQMWSLSKQVQPLFSYISQSKKSETPLIFAGFDCSHPQQIAQKHLIADLDLFLSGFQYPISTERHTTFNKILKELMLWEYNNSTAQEGQDLFFNELQAIKTYLGSHLGKDFPSIEIRERISFYLQLINSLEGFAKNAWSVRLTNRGAQLLNKYGNENGNVRDEYMASNAIWLINHKFKNHKIILWGATYHFTRNLARTDSLKMGINYDHLVTMGDILYKEIPNELYSIAFTAYQGEHGMPWGSPKKLEEPPFDSLEGLIHFSKITNCFIDLKNLPPKDHWLNQDIGMQPLGYKQMITSWPSLIDGVFFINQMNPSSTKD